MRHAPSPPPQPLSFVLSSPVIPISTSRKHDFKGCEGTRNQRQRALRSVSLAPPYYHFSPLASMSRRAASRKARLPVHNQPSISDYFSPSTPTPITYSLPSQHIVAHPAAASCEVTQASLLSVGMRVRKAVPEGYKTMSKTALLDMTSSSFPADMASGYARTRELAPYCGINKIGGYEAEPSPASYQSFENCDFGFPSSSQESMSSIASNDSITGAAQRHIRNERKRDRIDEDGDDVLETAMRNEIFLETRRIAKPMTRRRGAVGRAGLPLPPDDFEEAGFLQARSEDGSDVEMGI